MYMYMQLNINDCCCPACRTMNASKLVSVHFLSDVEFTEICSKCVCHTQPDLHTFLPLQYTSTMAVIVQLNINGIAAAQVFIRWTPPSLVSMHFQCAMELADICSRCIHRTQPVLHTLPSISDDVIRIDAIEYQWDADARLVVRWMPPSLVLMHFLGGEELTEICSKCVRALANRNQC